ncbi:MAG: PAS domain S-box protein, partial [Planctomycetes bacterium]|nr:PAS domain S-box protein [Planctomycetota bacterium]
SLDLICEADINTATFTKVNPAFTSVLGYSKKELLDCRFLDFIHPDDVNSTINVIEHYLKRGKKVLSFENRYRTKTGDYCWLDWTSSPSIDTGLTYAIGRNITERKKAECFVEKNAEILEMIATGQPPQIIYNAIALMYEARHPGMRCSLLELVVNKLMHGGAPSLPKEYCDAVNGLEYGICVGSCGTSTYTGKRVLVEDIATDPKWAALKDVALPHGMRSCWSEPIKNSAGKVLGAFGMYYNHPALPDDEELRDLESAARLTGIIMERKRAEVKLHKSEKQFRLLIESIQDGFYAYDRGTCLTHWNPTMERLLGLGAKNVVGKLAAEVFPFLENISEDESFREALEGKVSRCSIMPLNVAETGQKGWFESVHFPLVGDEGNITGGMSIIRDVTGRIKADESLRESEERFRMLVTTMPYGIQESDLDGIITFSNEAYARILGYSPDELVGKAIWAFEESKQGQEDTKQYLAMLIEEQPKPTTYFTINQRKDGTVIHVQIDWNYKRDSDGRLIGFVSVISDITVRKRYEAINTSRLHLLQFSAANSLDVLLEEVVNETEKLTGSIVGFFHFVEDDQETLTLQNWSTRTKSGFCKGEGKGSHYAIAKAGAWVDCIHQCKPVIHNDYDSLPHSKGMSEYDAEVVRDLVVPVIRGDKIKAILGVGNRNTDYNQKDVETVLQFASLAWDMAERKKLEEEVQKIHKLETVGILAGGIAHDFNNLLAAIRNSITLSMMQVDPENIAYKYLESTENVIHRAHNLTQQLLTFSKGGAPVKKAAYIIELIKESAEFVLRGSNIKCEYYIADNLWPVEVDTGQMSQVIQNLILNADQSMPEGGPIRISVENSELDANAGLELHEGMYLKIVIQDYGIGIAKEPLRNIFDPYFTTKEMGRGLGLSIVYSIIKNHGGHISVESEIGVGTTFTVYLPASEKQVEEKETIGDTFAVGEGKVLIMDDEEIIRQSLGDLLKYKGYEVECAKDGDEAIELYKKAMEASQPFNAVILDLTIRGGMGGKEAIKKLLEINPEVKAIVTSGYSNDPVLANFKDYGFCGVFAKINNIEELGKTLQSVIKGH